MYYGIIINSSFIIINKNFNYLKIKIKWQSFNEND